VQKPLADGWQVEVQVDGQPAIRHREPDDWFASRGWSESGPGEVLQKADPGRAALLMNRQFQVPDPSSPGSTRSPQGPANGILLWIAPAPPAKP
jgi:hypothetical protein